MRRLDLKVALDNIKDFMRIRKELKKRTLKQILQYLVRKAMGPGQRSFTLCGALSWTKPPATA